MNALFRYMIITAVICTLAPLPSAAKTGASEAPFDNVIVQDRKELQMTGTGMLKYMRMFKVYNAAFYLEAGASVDEVLDNKAKRLEVAYLRSFNKEDFGEATYQALRNSISAEQIERLRPRIDYHNSLYESVKPGDRYSLTYIPGKGTTLARNGREIGTIPGADFAAALFSIWVGDSPIDMKFRQQLLGVR